MDQAFIHGSLILERQILQDGAMLVHRGAIAWVGPTGDLPAHDGESVDLGAYFLAPGFIDLHVHGGGGIDSLGSSCSDLRTICKAHEAYGTTALCLALSPAPEATLARTLQAIAELAGLGTGGARLLGAYLEGPFLNPSRCGSHEVDYLREPDPALLRSFIDRAQGWLRVVSLAPELPESDALIRCAVEHGLVAAIGHTSATFEQTISAIQAGCRLATHLFNGMKPFHHRDPNAVGAVLSSGSLVAELIVDGVHLHPAATRLALRSMGSDRVALVTDATAVVGSPSGKGQLSGQTIHLSDGAARLHSGVLAGSAVTMVDAVRNLVQQVGVDLPTAVRCASLVPAGVLGIDDRVGSLAVGKHADFLVLDPADLRVLYTYVGGERVFRSPY